jgi:chemotaxis protein MotB
MPPDPKRPIIIKRKKIIQGGGHHGGAWKVAYADFVTAMMAFFMLMWLLNATTEKQRKGLADYFSPAIPIARVSGGGEGALSGNSIFTQDSRAQTGTGGLGSDDGVVQTAFGTAGTDEARARAAEDAALEAAAQEVLGLGGDSLVEELALKHVQSRITDEGLVIEMFDLPDSPLFLEGNDTPTDIMDAIARLIARMSIMVINDVAVNGYMRAQPVVLAQDISWDLSSARAHRTRILLEEAGMAQSRMRRVTGHGNRSLATTDIPMDVRNNRIEVVFLRAPP